MSLFGNKMRHRPRILRGILIGIIVLCSMVIARISIYLVPQWQLNQYNTNPMKPMKEDVQPLLAKNTAQNRSVQDVLDLCAPAMKKIYTPLLEAKGLSFPPKSLQLVAFKEERTLEIYAAHHFLRRYDFTAYSGKRGPKSKEGDRQIPEGIYGIEYLNPNSKFHVSMKISYPNQRDKNRAGQAGIENPGSDIFIHGSQKSIGCIAIGDANSEELFSLVAMTGLERVRVLIFPNDARKTGYFLPCEQCTDDTQELYEELREELGRF